MLLTLILVLLAIFLTAMLMVNFESFLRLKRPDAMPHRFWIFLVAACITILFFYGSLYFLGYDMAF